MIVAHRHDNAAMRGRARHIRMAHHVARTVHPRPLAVPQGKHAVIGALAPQFGLLTAPNGGGGKVFVQTCLELDLRLFQIGARAHHLLIHRAKGRAAIARHKPCGVQSGGTIARRLHQHQANKRLCAI